MLLLHLSAIGKGETEGTRALFGQGEGKGALQIEHGSWQETNSHRLVWACVLFTLPQSASSISPFLPLVPFRDFK